MAWDKGFNFRDTAVFVTDGPNETYFRFDDGYPVTRNGVTFGRVSGGNNSANRDATVDRRLAGILQQSNNGTQCTLRIDLPAAGDYIIVLALGDTGSAQSYQYVQFLDNTTVLATIDDTNGTGQDNYDDAAGVNRTEANWPSQNATITKTFASTILNIKFGSPTAQTNSTTIAHVFVSQVVVGGGPDAMFNFRVGRWA